MRQLFRRRLEINQVGGIFFLEVILMNRLKTGKVYLTGAGPGDPGLLTLKAVETLRRSSVVIYDALVNDEILRYAPASAERIYVGKRGGEPSIAQSEINDLLVKHARQGCTVTRLKGGDPFIFGRGGEEAAALRAAGIEFEVVPGISSGVAAAAYAGIPLTHRDFSSSVAFISGHHAGADKNIDWAATARMAETIVVFMCAENICHIAARLIENGRDAATPIAVIRWGTYTKQEVYTGKLGTIAALQGAGWNKYRALLETLYFKPPAIAIIGEVVALREKLKWFGADTLELAELAEVERI
jgi:uroporphyrinogen III methyltransferase / synthase